MEGEGGGDQAMTTAAVCYQLDTCLVHGLRRDVFPEGKTRRKLYQFFKKYQPVDPKVSLFCCYQSESQLSNSTANDSVH